MIDRIATHTKPGITYASTLLSAGKNPVWVASTMGHKNWAMIIKAHGRWIPSVAPDAGHKVVALWENTPNGDQRTPIQTNERKSHLSESIA